MALRLPHCKQNSFLGAEGVKWEVRRSTDTWWWTGWWGWWQSSQQGWVRMVGGLWGVGGCGGLWVAPFFCRRTENVLQASQVYIFEDIWPSGQIKRFWPSMQCTTLDVHWCKELASFFFSTRTLTFFRSKPQMFSMAIILSHNMSSLIYGGGIQLVRYIMIHHKPNTTNLLILTNLASLVP